MDLIQEIIAEIDISISRLKGEESQFHQGIIIGLSQAKLLILRESGDRKAEGGRLSDD